MKFVDLGLPEPILRAVAAEGYVTPTPIQAQAIGPALAQRDVLGCAQTGTGKTAAFALPILARLSQSRPQPADAASGSRRGRARAIRALVLSPTRELALQIAENFHAYGRNTPLRQAVVVGGVNQNSQVRALQHGVDILVATPGRLLDLMQQGYVDLNGVEVLVLDEADRMLDMGFIPDVRKIVARLPAERQTLFFSATMPNDIQRLADAMLRDPVRVRVAPVKETAELVAHSVFHVQKKLKPQLLAHVLTTRAISRALVFTRTKHGADRVVRQLAKSRIRAEAIHGNKSQAARQRTLANFKANRTPILVATDIAARGIDVEGISHVVNFDLPEQPETYVHRIGRTGRAGATGFAISFCDAEERGSLADIERLIRQRLPVEEDHPDYVAVPTAERSGQRPARREGRHSPSRPPQKSQPAKQKRKRSPAEASRGKEIPVRATISPLTGRKRRKKAFAH